MNDYSIHARIRHAADFWKEEKLRECNRLLKLHNKKKTRAAGTPAGSNPANNGRNWGTYSDKMMGSEIVLDDAK